MKADQLESFCRERAIDQHLQTMARNLGIEASEFGPSWRDWVVESVPFRKLTGVYFIRCGEFVKIGFSNHVPGRMKDIQVATPYELDLLRVMPGTKVEESRYHLRFKHHRHRLEWFRHAGDLREWLERPVACMLTDPTIRHQYGPLPV